MCHYEFEVNCSMGFEDRLYFVSLITSHIMNNVSEFGILMGKVVMRGNFCASSGLVGPAVRGVCPSVFDDRQAELPPHSSAPTPPEGDSAPNSHHPRW